MQISDHTITFSLVERRFYLWRDRGMKKQKTKKKSYQHFFKYRNTVFINTTIHFSEIQEKKNYRNTEIHKYKLQKYRNSNYRNTKKYKGKPPMCSGTQIMGVRSNWS